MWVCRLQLMLALASAVILGYESRGTPARSRMAQLQLLALGFPFVASYDSQGRVFESAYSPCTLDFACEFASLVSTLHRPRTENTVLLLHKAGHTENKSRDS
jgi:hypothetical protein